MGKFNPNKKMYFLCSEPVVDFLVGSNDKLNFTVSQKFKSGYKTDTENYFVIEVDVETNLAIIDHFETVIAPNNDSYLGIDNSDDVKDYSKMTYIDFWTRECLDSHIYFDVVDHYTGDDAELSLDKCKENGLFLEIENKLNFSTQANIAYVLFRISEIESVSPLELINTRISL